MQDAEIRSIINIHLNKLKNQLKSEINSGLTACNKKIEQTMEELLKQRRQEQARMREQIMRLYEEILKIEQNHIGKRNYGSLIASSDKIRKVVQKKEIINDREFSIDRLEKIDSMPQVQKIYDELTSIRKHCNEISYKLEYFHNQASKKSINKQKILDLLIDPECPHFKHFSIQEKEIELIEDLNGEYVQLLGKLSIAENPINRFKITTMKTGALFIGVLDKRYSKDWNSLLVQKRKQCLYYCTKTGVTAGGGYERKKGKRSKQGDQIVMSVQKFTIKWIVNGKIRAEDDLQLISNFKTEWVPVVWLISKGDKITWS